MKPSEEEKLLKEALINFVNNLTRTTEVAIVGRKQIEENFKKESRDDILRLSVVFLHASLESILREIFRVKASNASVEVINKIPLIGSKSRDAQKFYLGRLCDHREKTVEIVIQASIDSHVEHLSITSTKDIAALLEKIEIKIDDQDEYYRDLEQMISRRHQIVHRADQMKENGSNNLVLSPIDDMDFRLWIGTLSGFIVQLYKSLFGDKASDNAIIKKLLEGLEVHEKQLRTTLTKSLGIARAYRNKK